MSHSISRPEGPNQGWLARYDGDAPAPIPRQVARDIGVRSVLPALVLLALNLAIGFAIMGPGGGWPFETAVNRDLQAGRTPTLDTVTRVISAMGGIPANIILCVVAVALAWWLTRRWWVALLAPLALGLEVMVHAVTTAAVGRERPGVPQLDIAQPTASFPSGHVGATLTQVLVVLFLLNRASTLLARLAWGAVGLAFIALMVWSRLYLGMHHVSDVAVGLLNGVVCAVLAWNYLAVPRGVRPGPPGEAVRDRAGN